MYGRSLDTSRRQESRAQGLAEGSLGDVDDLVKDALPGLHQEPLVVLGLCAVQHRVRCLLDGLSQEI
eukprot:6326313-Pyramimonas_sp.AAC.1